MGHKVKLSFTIWRKSQSVVDVPLHIFEAGSVGVGYLPFKKTFNFGGHAWCKERVLLLFLIFFSFLFSPFFTFLLAFLKSFFLGGVSFWGTGCSRVFWVLSFGKTSLKWTFIATFFGLFFFGKGVSKPFFLGFKKRGKSEEKQRV